MSHIIRIELSADHNASATPIAGQYPIEVIRKRLEAADAVAGVMDETALNEEIQKHAADSGIALAAPDNAAVLLALKMALNLQGQHQLRTAMVRTMVVASSVASAPGGASSVPCSV